MNLHRKHTALCCLVACVIVGAGDGLAAEWGAPTVSGSLGYDYRSLDGVDDTSSKSHQTLGSLFINSYLWRPWIGTADLSMTAALSSSSSESRGGSVDNDSSILAGSLNLNMLPQSRSPLNLRYMVTDTRVDVNGFNTDALVVLNDGDSTSEKLGLTQVYTWEAGHRLRATYDHNEWSSDRNGNYTDETLAAELDMRGAGYHMITNAKSQEATRSVGSLVNETTALDTTHYYYPTKAFRLDSRASLYNFERGFDVPSSNDQSGTSTSEITQASTFGFWRPAGSPWSLSGGLRVFDLSGENDGDVPESNESQNISATLGGFYQYNKRMRYDFSLAHTTNDSNDISSDLNRLRLGMLYQSDMITLDKFMYQWYVNTSFDSVFLDVAGVQEDRMNYNLALGHNVQRSWMMENALSFRMSGSQVVTGGYADISRDGGLVGDAASDVQRIEHSVTMNLHHSGANATSYAQLTMSDGRSFGSTELDQQMVWFQVYRDHRLTSMSTFSGNVSVQYVRHNYESNTVSTEVTTTTGQLSYRKIAFFWVPKLNFLSDILVSKASEEEGIDRQEWENRLDYAIGQLTASLSHRVIEYDDNRYQLTFFRVERQF